MKSASQYGSFSGLNRMASACSPCHPFVINRISVNQTKINQPASIITLSLQTDGLCLQRRADTIRLEGSPNRFR